MVMLRPLSGLKTPSVLMILFRAWYTLLYCAFGSGCRHCILVWERMKRFLRHCSTLAEELKPELGIHLTPSGWKVCTCRLNEYWCIVPVHAVTLFWHEVGLAAARSWPSDACLVWEAEAALRVTRPRRVIRTPQSTFFNLERGLRPAQEIG